MHSLACRHVILVGDLNVSHQRIDHCDPDLQVIVSLYSIGIGFRRNNFTNVFLKVIIFLARIQFSRSLLQISHKTYFELYFVVEKNVQNLLS